MAKPSLRAFLDRSLELMRREAPDSYSRFCGTLVGHPVCVTSAVEAFALESRGDSAFTTIPRGNEAIVTRVEADTILAMADGGLTIDEALRLDRLVVHAPLAEAVTLFTAFERYLRGAVRCQSFPGLLHEFRSATCAQEVRRP